MGFFGVVVVFWGCCFWCFEVFYFFCVAVVFWGCLLVFFYIFGACLVFLWYWLGSGVILFQVSKSWSKGRSLWRWFFGCYFFKDLCGPFFWVFCGQRWKKTKQHRGLHLSDRWAIFGANALDGGRWRGAPVGQKGIGEEGHSFADLFLILLWVIWYALPKGLLGFWCVQESTSRPSSIKSAG